jgi:hypothetical protein
MILLVLQEQRDNPDLNNQMSADEIFSSIIRNRPTLGITITDVEKVLDEMNGLGCDKRYFYKPLNLEEVSYEAPFCQCSPACITENQTEKWHEYEVCTNCNRPIERSAIPIGDE